MVLQDTMTLTDSGKRHEGAQISRRAAFGLGVVGAMSAIKTGDSLVTQLKWPNDKTILKAYETPFSATKDPEAAWVVLGGLGVQDSFGIMNALMPSFSGAKYAMSVRYPDTGLDIDALSEEINRASHHRGVRAVYVFAHSMSGAMVPDLVQRLDKDAPLSRAVFNCTPWTQDYVVDREIVEIISKLPIKGSFMGKFAVQIADRMRNSRDDSPFIAKLRRAWQITNDQGSPETWLSQIQFLASKTLSDYQEMIPENLKSAYVAPRNATDGVVLLTRAIDTYETDIPGDKTISFTRSNGHANPRQRPDDYIAAMRMALPVYSSGMSSNRSVGGKPALK